ncbi:Pre-mRNA-splicing factor [Lunasporangiospora selenospora]|uniref:Pre-mRNA-splicing factor n=1 Tax=Lunasporangiospora selenospora TaxID=979761 RepID=A0A9P6G2K9_9FUNG|nr:Pre-mRNA-splicing factor [Lunasporangiospora selenospora]
MFHHGQLGGNGGDSRNDRSAAKTKATHRCDPVRDSGRTKGTFNPNAYFCAFFAKGCCPNGENCSWLHRIPTRQDHVDTGMDVFGRERFDDHRDDHGGVGSMRTGGTALYVGRIQPHPQMEATVEKHFKLWGELERIKILKEKGVAFVTYQSRLNAEFAKEAMANQSLDHGEIINIRWATEDPNPKAQSINKRKAVEMTRQAIESKLSADFKQAQSLPGSEEAEFAGTGKRTKQDTSDAMAPSQEPAPTLYVGPDGNYYYDYGTYGYNHETHQYDPARLGQYHASTGSGSTNSSSYQQRPVTLQDQIKTSLSMTNKIIQGNTLEGFPSTGRLQDSVNKPKPTLLALAALAAYGSDSESDDTEGENEAGDKDEKAAAPTQSS